MKVHNKKVLKEIRRDLRQLSTKAEELLWQELRSRRLNGKKFKRQHSIGNYIVDFYCASSRLIIEADGGIHLEKEQKIKDEHRDENFRDMNFKVLRLTNKEIENNMPKVLKRIRQLLTKQDLLPSP